MHTVRIQGERTGGVLAVIAGGAGREACAARDAAGWTAHARGARVAVIVVRARRARYAAATNIG